MCEMSARSILFVISISVAADDVLCQNRFEIETMPLERDVEAAVALAEAFKEQIGAGAEADPARAMGEKEG